MNDQTTNEATPCGQEDHLHVHDGVESCQQLLSSLGEYVDGSLGVDLCTEIERHMRDCPNCRVVVDTLKKTVELYQQTAEDPEIPADVRERLYLRLNLEDFLKK